MYYAKAPCWCTPPCATNNSLMSFQPWNQDFMLLALRCCYRFLRLVSGVLLSAFPGMESFAEGATALEDHTYLDYTCAIWVAIVDEAESASEQYERIGDLDSLLSCVAAWRCACEFCPDGHSQELGLLNNFCTALQTLYTVTGNLAVLHEAIALGTRVVEATPDDNTEKPGVVSNLGSAVHSRFDREGDLADLHTAIALKTLAVSLLPDNDPDRPAHLDNLGYVLQSRFERLGDIADLHEAIAMKTEALDLVSDDDPEKPAFLNKLSTAIQLRFKYLGSLADLEQVISLKSRAVELTPNGHPDKSLRLDSLGISLQARFEHTGSLEDLQDAIAIFTRAVDLIPDTHVDKASRLSNLGTALQSQFERLEATRDIQEAIEVHVRANELVPDGHPDKAYHLNNLGIAVQSRFMTLQNLSDVEEAISLKTKAVELTPDDSPDKCSRLNNLGTALQSRFEFARNFADLEAAIVAYTRAIELTSGDRPDKVLWQCNLGTALLKRFEHAGNASDLDAAVVSMASAVRLVPSGHPRRTMMLRKLGQAHSARLNSPHAQAHDWVAAVEAFAQAMMHKAGPPDQRLLAGLDYLDLLPHSSSTISPPIPVLHAHRQLLDLVPHIFWLGFDIPRRYEDLMEFGTLANRAAADAIEAGEYACAVEWLESGRTIVWGQILRLRTPLDDLRHQNPELAADLQRVSGALWHFGDSQAITSMQAKYATYSLALEYERLIAQIRELDGFDDFLKPRKLSQLVNACISGPVVVVNVHQSRCDALALRHSSGDSGIIHIPLTEFSYHHAKQLQEQLWNVLKARRLLSRFRDAEQEEETHRGIKPPNRKFNAVDPMRAILSDLWTRVVKPVVDAVIQAPTSNSGGKLPHITWCPTGPLVFLPLHAAGIYSDEEVLGQRIFDIAVSSYTPTLEALLKPQPPKTPASSANNQKQPRVLVVTQPSTPGYSSIPGTQKEADIVQSAFNDTTSVLSHAQGTVNAVLEAMKTHDWIHLACHGVQQPEDPLNCWFALYNGRLTLSRLMSQSLYAELAVLSACQTATGNEKLPEEAVHLSAGMLTVGFRSVIGTMWSIFDRSAPIVMERFYGVLAEQLAAEGRIEPAYALHEAIKALREDCGQTDFIRWVPFVHFGL